MRQLLSVPIRRLEVLCAVFSFGVRLYLELLRSKIRWREALSQPTLICAIEHQRYPALCDWLRLTLRRVPFWAEGHYYLALCSLGIGRHLAAELSLRAYCQLKPKRAESRQITLLKDECLRQRAGWRA